MEYICHHNFNGITACGEKFACKRGDKFQSIGAFISYPPSKGLCYITSENACKYFARNDDGKGLQRGRLTYKIAYAKRERMDAQGHVFRFSPDEQDMLRNEYAHFLEDTPTILFNTDFFHADVKDLKQLAKRLEM